jgi:hypothetical protein
MKKSDTCVVFSLAHQDFIIPGGAKQAAILLAALGDCMVVRRTFSSNYLESFYQLQEPAELGVKIVSAAQIVPKEPERARSEVEVESRRLRVNAGKPLALIGGNG